MKSTAEGALIAVEGYPFIAIAAAFTALSMLLGWAVAAVVGIVLTVWVVWFFRNPARITPEGDDLVVAPADGRILAVDTAPLPNGKVGKRVCIFMNVFNVHVNRYPVTGEVTNVEYVPGRFINASFDKASEYNERNALTMQTPHGHTVRFVQIAGLVARRIVCWAEKGANGGTGDIFGLIRFGSRVDVHVPAETEIFVQPGQRVTAGETILGELPSTPDGP